MESAADEVVNINAQTEIPLLLNRLKVIARSQLIFDFILIGNLVLD